MLQRYGAAVRVEVVVNRGAGSIDGEAITTERRRVAEAFAATGLRPRTAVVAGGALESAVRAAAERGADVVAVAGGDGSLGTAASALDGTGSALGVLPLGTFNHFAKDLGVPIDLAAAAEVVVGGDTRAVDIGEVNGRVFLNNSSIGLYPVMVDVRDEIRTSRGWGKIRSVPVASVRVLRRFPTRRLRIEVGGEQWIRRSPFVFVGNNAYDVGPRGVGARTALDEGVLCCYVADAENRRRFVKLALGAALRGAARTPDLHSASAPHLWIDAHGHRILVAVDGEVVTLRAPLLYRCRPGALRVRVPAGTEPPPADAPPAGSGVDVASS